jgi:hypothetical protein
MQKTFYVSLAMAVILGLAAAWIDSRPGWDDTGISVLMILSISSLCGFISQQKPWLIALATAIWIPLFGILSSNNYGGFLALIPAFVGAYAGFLVRRFFAGKQSIDFLII